jgi:hypothetical protein
MGEGNGSNCALGRRLHFEALEDRRLLAVLIVNSQLDVASNDGSVTLREAINAANTNTATELGHVGSGVDTIQFAPGLSGQTITLQGSFLSATESLTIDGSTLDNRITIIAPPGGRVFQATIGGDYGFIGLTLTGNMFADGNVFIADSEVTGASLGGPYSYAAGVEATGNITLQHSRVSGHDGGGGIHASGNVVVQSSTIEDNRIAHDVSQPGGNPLIGGLGGGVFAFGNASVANSTISGNFAAQDGGGVWANGDASITNSTIYGNVVGSSYYSSAYEPGRGGGIFANGHVTVTSSTISGNETYGSVGGDGYYGPYVYPGLGGGIWSDNGTLTIVGSIVANNFAYLGNDILAGTGAVSAQYSLVGNNDLSGLAGAPLGTPDANGNLIGTNSDPIDPMLGKLGDNGGPTHTLALLPNSPAINAGDPLANGAPMFDQRGAPWARISGGRIDMGAFEVQAESLHGDYNDDGIVDAVDYTVWRNTVGSMSDFRADGSGPTVGVPDGVVDAHDYDFWKANYGNMLPTGSGGVALAEAGASESSSRNLPPSNEPASAPIRFVPFASSPSPTRAPADAAWQRIDEVDEYSAPLLAWSFMRARTSSVDEPFDGSATDDREYARESAARDSAFQLLGDPLADLLELF